MSTSPLDNQTKTTKKFPVPLIFETIDSLKNAKIVPLIYPGGASGEFFASALVQTLPKMTLTRYNWYNNMSNRANFYDIFDHRLNGGHNIINNEEIIEEVNMYYFVNHSTLKDFNIALVHPEPQSSIDWLNANLINSPTLEIITKNPRSRRFRTLASNTKISYPGRKYTDGSRYVLSDFCGTKHLRLEWEEIFLTDVEAQFRKIEEFFEDSGDFVLYKELVTDYVARNQSLIDQSA